MLLVLTWAAGCVDAISYLGLNRVFTAMMTGNTVLLGLALGQGEIQAAAVRRLGVPGIATRYITGMPTSLMVDLVGWMRLVAGSSSREVENDGKPVNESSEVRWEQRVGLLAGVFFVYGFGALTGGVLQTRSSSLAARSPLIAMAVVAITASMR